MDTTYSGEHSIIFDYGLASQRHSWEDWALVPASRPSVAMPTVNTSTLEIPGANGILDLTDIPLGMPTYKTRSGSWSFNVAHDKLTTDWVNLDALLAAYFHGKTHTCILTDDKSYYYQVRFQYESYKVGNVYSTVTIKYELQPFKYMIWSTAEPWLWDPFDLVYGVIPQSEFVNIPITSGVTKTITWTQNQIGEVPVTPTFKVEALDGEPFTLKITNSFNRIGEQTFSIEPGETTKYEIMFACPNIGDTTTIKISGNGRITIDYRPGRL